MKRIILSTIAVLCLAASAVAQNGSHFISDANYRQKVDKDFNEKMSLLGKQFYDTKGLNVTPLEDEAMRFLYAYMAMADVTDYPTEFYLKNVRSSFETRRLMAWGNKVPELLFRHFVLPVRVNNENLDESRWIFFDELKERVRGLHERCNTGSKPLVS